MKFNTHRTNLAVLSAFTAALAFAVPQAFAGGSHGGDHGKGASIGKPGLTNDVARTITVVMQDNFYEPENLTVSAGETVRFVIKNIGELVHEFNIGTASMHAVHQKEMEMMVEHGMLEADKINRNVKMTGMSGMGVMAHNDPNSVLLEPGMSAEIIWRFENTTGLEFACNVPGHYEAGMIGEFQFQPLKTSALDSGK